jgi:hypothetical protein
LVLRQEKIMNVRRVIIAAAVMGGSYLVPAGADAALISTDTAAMAGYRGVQPFTSEPAGGLIFHASVEFAVYAPGQFQTSAALGNPTDPSGGSDYVYAYILSNVGLASERTVGELSVGLDGDTLAHNIAVLSVVPSGMNPSSSAFVPLSVPYASATWIYSPELTNGQTSNLLIFTSPRSPQLYNASVLGGALHSQQTLPSPIPEPASLMVLGGMALLAVRALRPR